MHSHLQHNRSNSYSLYPKQPMNDNERVTLCHSGAICCCVTTCPSAWSWETFSGRLGNSHSQFAALLSLVIAPPSSEKGILKRWPSLMSKVESRQFSTFLKTPSLGHQQGWRYSLGQRFCVLCFEICTPSLSSPSGVQISKQNMH